MLVYELMEGGTLESLLFSPTGPGLAWQVRAELLYGMHQLLLLLVRAASQLLPLLRLSALLVLHSSCSWGAE